MRKILILALLTLVSACATTPTTAPTDSAIQPYALAARSLQASKTAIVTAAKTADALCAQGVLKQADCDLAKSSYQKATASWETALQALVFALDTGNLASYEQRAADLANLQNSFIVTVNAFKGGTQ